MSWRTTGCTSKLSAHFPQSREKLWKKPRPYLSYPRQGRPLRPPGDEIRTTDQFCRRDRTPAGPRAAQVCRPCGFNGTVCENETVPLIRHLLRKCHLPPGEGLRAAKGRPYRTYKRLSGEYRRGRSQTGPPSIGKFPGYGGRGTPQGGFSCPCGAIHLQPLPYKITGTFPNLRRGAPWGSRQDSQR